MISEGTVVGFTWGSRTDEGRRLGRMGTLIIKTDAGDWLYPSEFTDLERLVRPTRFDAPDESGYLEGTNATEDWEPELFPRGTRVTIVAGATIRRS